MPGDYFARATWRNPSRHPIRIAGAAIECAAEAHFSGRLLEIGCGTKAKSQLVGRFVDRHVGLDHAATPHGVDRVDLLGDAHALPAKTGSFDCVLSTAVLEHLEEPVTALAEACRVLTPGGVAIYTLPLFWPLHEEPRDFYRYTRFGAEHLFRRAGFELVEVRPLSGFWITFGAMLGKYLQRFRRRPITWGVDACVAALNLATPWLDRGCCYDDRFTWMYLVVARKASRCPLDRPASDTPR